MLRMSARPSRAAWSNPQKALLEALSPDERKWPLTIYMHPGIVSVKAILQVLFLVYGLIIAASSPDVKEAFHSKLPWISFLSVTGSYEHWADGIERLLASLVLAVLYELFATVFVRLALQELVRPTAQPYVGEIRAAQDKQDSTENVIQLHPCKQPEVHFPPPYAGVVDCIKKVTTEEGCTSLFRGMWYSTLGILFTIVILNVIL